MKVSIYINHKLVRIVTFIRMLRFYYFFKSYDVIIYKNLTCRFKPNKINVGKGLKILQNCVLEFNRASNITIGNNCILSYGVVIAISDNFVMGNNVMVGEYTSIRDTTHDYQVIDKPMSSSTDINKPIFIGNDVWIGRGCIIFPGTIIEDGVVVGANSVIKGHLLANTIYGGNPLRKIKDRI